MRFSAQILVSLLAITPVVVVSVPAPQDAYSSDIVPDVGTGSASDTVILSSAPSSVSASISESVSASAAGPGASGGAGGGKSCTRGRGGRGRFGHGRPTNLPFDSAPSSAVTVATSSEPVGPSSEYESPPIIEQPASESASGSAPGTEVPEPSTPVEEAPVQEVPVGSPSVQEVPAASSAGVSEEVDLAATGQSGPGLQQGGGAAQPSETSSAASSAPSTDTGSGGPAEGFEADILRLTNEYRAQFDAGPMVWNASAALLAQEHYTQTGCVMEHAGFNGLGENLQSSQGPLSAQSAIDGWGPGEEADYPPPADSKKVTGHFTQLVWKGSTHLGCAYVQCPNGNNIIACEYSPPGNMLGDFKNNVGKT